MSRTRVMESRPYDAYFDPTFTSASAAMAMDPRVAAAVSNGNAVSGTTRFKYFRRPIMPRATAVPPSILLAPVAPSAAIVPVQDLPEPPTKSVEVQTAYRESEAQTDPYSPEYVVPPGQQPEILLLQDLKVNRGLPISQNEIDQIHQARIKRDLESFALPMTDEACFQMKRRLAEAQELREYKLQEVKMDQMFEQRLQKLHDALEDRNETHEFLASQRVESIRQTRMDEREQALQKIRKNRIKVLRRLARKRNDTEPMMSGANARDVISEYFDKGSSVYAPLKREGALTIRSKAAMDINLWTQPLNTLEAITSVEHAIPQRVKSASAATFDPNSKMMSQTWSGRSAASRLSAPPPTSLEQRVQRKIRSDVEMMYNMIVDKKLKSASVRAAAAATMRMNQAATANSTAPSTSDGGMRSQSAAATGGMSGPSIAVSTADSSKDGSNRPSSSLPPSRAAGTPALLMSKPKGRPDTPDIASRSEGELSNHPFKCAVVLLQRLVRGRAVQNRMYEGRLRHKELIAEMRAADDAEAEMQEADSHAYHTNKMDELRTTYMKQTLLDNIVGHLALNTMNFLEQELDRSSVLDGLLQIAKEACTRRYAREAAEAGRRQREAVPILIPDSFGVVKSSGASYQSRVHDDGGSKGTDSTPQDDGSLASDV